MCVLCALVEWMEETLSDQKTFLCFVRLIKSRRMELAGHVARMGDI
jgi:hypothetical protein